GAHQSQHLRIPGEDKKGVYHGIDFLRDVALDKMPDIAGKRVAVVGGGNVAIDAARTAWRLGAKEVNVIYRRTRQDMPAYAEELDAAEEEGVIFHYLTNPVRVLGGDHVTAVELQNQELGEFDRSGRRRPAPVEGSVFQLNVDVLIPAIGQRTDPSCVPEDCLEWNRNATVKVDQALATTRAAVFAAGDMVSGPASVIDAVAQGNQAAMSVDHYLKTGKVVKVPYKPPYRFPKLTWNMDDYADAQRVHHTMIPVEARRGSFHEVELTLEEKAIREECRRCLRCDLEWLETREVQPAATSEPVAAD
ncbi:MAG: FAD-dependent oxidoreductase, partial [Chloroflexi bacterium]|nr:FAD-dependent oxidoreductase [Chloroflexota bacterium]